jgi:hypothetical protein
MLMVSSRLWNEEKRLICLLFSALTFMMAEAEAEAALLQCFATNDG